MRLVLWIFVTLAIFWNLSLATPAALTKLSNAERSQIRYNLENIWNEVHLLVLNEKADEQDIRRQEREFEFFQIFERIPLSKKTDLLIKELTSSAKEQGIMLSKIEIIPSIAQPAPIPEEVSTHSKRFRFSEDQLVETLKIKIVGKSSLKTAEDWLKSWPKGLVRLVIADSQPQELAQNKSWEIHAHAFRFRSVEYPRLIPRDPLEILPSWTRKDPQAFAQQEPFLWSFISRYREWKPKAGKAYENRRRFLLNDQRMSFYLHQAKEIPPQS